MAVICFHRFKPQWDFQPHSFLTSKRSKEANRRNETHAWKQPYSNSAEKISIYFAEWEESSCVPCCEGLVCGSIRRCTNSPAATCARKLFSVVVLETKDTLWRGCNVLKKKCDWTCVYWANTHWYRIVTDTSTQRTSIVIRRLRCDSLTRCLRATACL